MSSANAASSAATSASHQPGTQTASANQVRVASRQEQPPLPRRSSSLLVVPALRRRASEPLPPGLRQRYAQRPGETHTRYTYGLAQADRCSGYTFGLAQREYCDDDDDDEGWYAQSAACRSGTRYRFVPNSQTCSNLNRFEYGYPHSQRFADMHGYPALDNTHGRVVFDAQGNARNPNPRHSRSRTLDDFHVRIPSQGNAYTENIRAMAGQMYGDPPPHSRAPARSHRFADMYIDAHSHNHAHNRALTRQHYGYSGEL